MSDSVKYYIPQHINIFMLENVMARLLGATIIRDDKGQPVLSSGIIQLGNNNIEIEKDESIEHDMLLNIKDDLSKELGLDLSEYVFTGICDEENNITFKDTININLLCINGQRMQNSNNYAVFNLYDICPGESVLRYDMERVEYPPIYALYSSCSPFCLSILKKLCDVLGGHLDILNNECQDDFYFSPEKDGLIGINQFSSKQEKIDKLNAIIEKMPFIENVDVDKATSLLKERGKIDNNTESAWDKLREYQILRDEEIMQSQIKRKDESVKPVRKW